MKRQMEGNACRLTAHQAAVKALAWCPFQSNLLASGGGTADRSIRFWNTITGAHLNAIDTHSQARLPSIVQQPLCVAGNGWRSAT